MGGERVGCVFISTVLEPVCVLFVFLRGGAWVVRWVGEVGYWCFWMGLKRGWKQKRKGITKAKVRLY